MNLFPILVTTSRLWWRSWIGMVLLGVLWLLLQIPLVTGPPATAVFYAICLRIYRDEVWDYQDMWGEFRRLFGASWRWGVPNLLLIIVMVGNFVAYQSLEGANWDVLRMLWGGIALGWLMLNLFYWPFWLAQEDKSVKVTYQNVGRFFIMQPLATVAMTLLAAVVGLLSVLYILPLVIGGMGWVMLLTITAVQQSLAHSKTSQSV